MKKFLAIALSVFFVFGAAGNALAAFSYGTESSLAISITDKTSAEFGYDLGVLDVDFAMTDQNVTLAQAGDLSYVGDFVGIYSATSQWEMTFGLGIDTIPTVSTSKLANFQGGTTDIFNFGYNHISPATITPSDLRSYTTKFSNGSYGGLLTGITPDYEVELDFTDGYTDVYMYTYKAMTAEWDAGNIIRLYDDGSAVLNPTSNPVPVPAAAWLLGSGLLGLVGLRRRNS